LPIAIPWEGQFSGLDGRRALPALSFSADEIDQLLRRKRLFPLQTRSKAGQRAARDVMYVISGAD